MTTRGEVLTGAWRACPLCSLWSRPVLRFGWCRKTMRVPHPFFTGVWFCTGTPRTPIFSARLQLCSQPLVSQDSANAFCHWSSLDFQDRVGTHAGFNNSSTYIARSLYYPKRWESGYKDDWWAFLPIQVHQWREGVKENEPLLSTYFVHWTISYFILLWNWASGRLSNLPGDTQLLFGNQGLTPHLWLQSYCSLHPWSNYCLTCCRLWCSLQIWVRKGLFFATFSSASIRLKHIRALSMFPFLPQTFAIPLPRIPSLLPFNLLCHLLQEATGHNSRSEYCFPSQGTRDSLSDLWGCITSSIHILAPTASWLPRFGQVT